MATRSSVLSLIVQWTEEPGGLQSMGSQRVRRDWARTHIFEEFWAGYGTDLFGHI